MHIKRDIRASIFSLLSFFLVAAGLSSIAIADQNTLHTTTDKKEGTDTDGLSPEMLVRQYSERITQLDLEIRNESERRTTLLNQLDQIIDEISALDEKSQSTPESTSFTENLVAINAEAAELENEIRHDENLLKRLQATLEHQPELSVWQAALGSPEIQTRQRLIATQSYLIFTTKKHQQQLQSKRKLLDKRYQSLTEYENNIKQSIGQMRDQYDQLIERRKHLEDQVTEISALIVARQDRRSSLSERSDQAISNPASLYFGKFEKELPDPVEGRVIRKFSEPKAKGLLKWKGILVEAPLGLPFVSVSDGIVVFADELQGLGKVAIVDHGYGYMTLYGMAELLLVEKDQFLLAGDPVGTIGESVGADTSALYFEVRHNADVLNPQDWLKMHQIKQKNVR